MNMKLKLKTKILHILVLCAVILGAILPASAFVQAEPYETYEKNIVDDSYNQIQDGSQTQVLDDTQNQKYAPGEIIVKFKPGVSREKIATINSKQGTKEIYTSSYAGFKLLKIPKSKTIEEMVEIYSKNPNIEYALPNAIAQAAMVPNDPLYSYQWNLKDGIGGINVEPAWDISTGQGVVVAVLDTGVAYENYGLYIVAPGLSKTNFVPGYDFVNNDAHPNDDHHHGTHVSGTVAQNTNDGYGVAGVAYGCSIMPVKVLDGNGNGTLQQLIDGIYFATDNGADIISMSLSFGPGYYPGQALDDALEYSYNNGVTIVAAAGNDQTGSVNYPAAYYRCIAVGATNFNGVKADYSNYGTDLDVVAPGGDGQDLSGDGYMDGVLQNTFNIQTNDPTDFNWWFLTGTSMATPHVSGIAALMLEANSEATPYDIREALENTARDMGDQGWDQYYGHGLVNAPAALEYITQPQVPNIPPIADAGGPYSEEIGQPITFDGSGSYDSDGYITSYEWDFGDGSTGSGIAPNHAYSSAGTYNVTLTVWDNRDASGTDTVTLVAENVIHIDGVSVTTTSTKIIGKTYVNATAVVTILDKNNNPVEGATVSGYWSGAASDTDSAVTGATGTATVNSDEVIYPKKSTLTFTFTVNDVSHTLTWDGNTASGVASYP